MTSLSSRMALYPRLIAESDAMRTNIAEIGLPGFAALVFDAVEQTGGVKLLAHRWGVAPQSITRWRDQHQTPSFARLCQINFNERELLVVTRMLAQGRVQVSPMAEPARLALQHNQTFGVSENDVRGMSLQLTHEATDVAQAVHDALSDGRVDADETLVIDRKLDVLEASARKVRPGWWQRVTGMLRRRA